MDEDTIDRLVQKCVQADGSCRLTLYWSTLSFIVNTESRAHSLLAVRGQLFEDGLIDVYGRATSLGVLVAQRARDLVDFCHA